MTSTIWPPEMVEAFKWRLSRSFENLCIIGGHSDVHSTARLYRSSRRLSDQPQLVTVQSPIGVSIEFSSARQRVDEEVCLRYWAAGQPKHAGSVQADIASRTTSYSVEDVFAKWNQITNFDDGRVTHPGSIRCC